MIYSLSKLLLREVSPGLAASEVSLHDYMAAFMSVCGCLLPPRNGSLVLWRLARLAGDKAREVSAMRGSWGRTSWVIEPFVNIILWSE